MANGFIEAVQDELNTAARTAKATAAKAAALEHASPHDLARWLVEASALRKRMCKLQTSLAAVADANAEAGDEE
jgi:hypothetical protein